ncbi:OmpP1/FadL family transporter [Thiotrichales bacterium 19S3-7]|nr:OmpP1/FadL family transporter [Thiotrichales bacterium 19S3-7]MCF6802979.1 OmpP1/FadL family transporter [Thiotrichales bacterium 19S3-11]
MRLIAKSFFGLFILFPFVISYHSAFASAYQIFEQDARSLGTYHAGSSAIANDASTLWYNPAGMTNLTTQQFSLGSELVNTSIIYNGTQTNVGQITPSTPQPVDNLDGGTLTPIPNFYYVFPYKQWAFGLGIVAPFGAETNYGNGTALMYSGTKTQLQSIDFIPAIAYKINQYISFGIGADITYVRGEFDNAFAYINDTFQPTNIYVTNRGDDWTIGTHIGALINLNKNNRIGLVYHSKMTANLTGYTKMSGDTSGVTIAGSPTSGYNFSSQIILPAWWDFSYYSKVTNKLALMASIIYTQWNSVQQTELKNVVTPFGNSYQNVLITQDFRNTWNFSFGTTFDLSPKWQIKAGIGYDMTPTNDTYRNIQIPDQNRFILATGIEYTPIDSLTIALSYAHFFVKDASINVTQEITGTYQTTNGTVDSSADLFGLQLIWRL